MKKAIMNTMIILFALAMCVGCGQSSEQKEDIIRKTKCFDFWERNVLFPKTKRSFFRTPTLPFSA